MSQFQQLFGSDPTTALALLSALQGAGQASAPLLFTPDAQPADDPFFSASLFDGVFAENNKVDLNALLDPPAAAAASAVGGAQSIISPAASSPFDFDDDEETLAKKRVRFDPEDESTPGPSNGKDDDAKVEKRKRNSAASARFRLKKKLKEQELEKSANELKDRADRAEKRVTELEAEVRYLKELLLLKNSK